ncbi:hypothetical protein NLI96_g9093 [Meripilus lineatus]|uniref:Auxin efflux carrier n=1 Tax=Meripilus lineatus TaxID=2056292 RepID=A0AAD5YD92_9APHY|nr:hypothetical protein NLI96_g9093 [Physisporinus lineatus]
MLPLGALVWVSLRPLLRLVICVGCGFAITKADIFPVVAARGAGQITLNIALPCLMFSKIVPAFTPENISALGPLVLIAFIYEGIGIIIAWFIKQFFWIPHRFRYGILVAGGWGNYADIPTSVVMSITASAPFSGAQDQTLAVAYISAFILVFFFTLFPFGGHKMVAWDFIGPDVENDEVKQMSRTKRRKVFKNLMNAPRLVVPSRRPGSHPDPEKADDRPESMTSSSTPEVQSPIPQRIHPAQRHVSFNCDTESTEPAIDIEITPITSPEPTIVHADTMTFVDSSTIVRENPDGIEKTDIPPLLSPASPPLRLKLAKRVKSFLSSLLLPPSISIILSFTIALVTPLKALFVPIPTAHIPNAPDGQPPLAFIQDAASFIGGASVPLGLMCLGSALARLKVPRNQWSSLPVGAITSLALGKMVITPVIGVFICQGLTNAGIIDPNDKVLRFVCIFFSCLPTATTQVYLTQVYSGTGEAEHISAFLIPQYALMIFAMTILTGFSLHLIF